MRMSTRRSGCPQGTLASVLGGDREQLGLRLGLVSVVTGGTGQGGSVSSWRPLRPHGLPGWTGEEAGGQQPPLPPLFGNKTQLVV